jgi:hypothetical protein
MATVIELMLAQKLFKLDPALEPNEREWRWIYALPPFKSRVEIDLPHWTSHWKVEESPTQQMDALLEVFCSGETITYGPQFKPLVHLGDGIWELKTPDLRLFGWFSKRDCFIAGALDTAFNVKSYNLYPGHAGVVCHLRSHLDLDEPKFVPGNDPNVVVSNYDYP